MFWNALALISIFAASVSAELLPSAAGPEPALIVQATTPQTLELVGSLPNSPGAKEVDWGDGSVTGLPSPCGTDPICALRALPIRESHTYMLPGTYTLTLRRIGHIQELARLSGTALAWHATEASPDVTSRILNLTPVSGSAPLTVEAAVRGQGDRWERLIVDYGDGAQGKLSLAAVTCDDRAPGREPCLAAPALTTHTYTNAGAYWLTVNDPVGSATCLDLPRCGKGMVARGLVMVNAASPASPSPDTHWDIGPWSDCVDGQQSRDVVCRDNGGNVVNGCPADAMAMPTRFCLGPNG